MASQSSQKTSSSSGLMWILLLLVLAVGGYYVYTMYIAPTPESGLGTVQPINLSKTDWNKNLFQRPAFMALTSPVPLPFESGPTGNPQPFIDVK